MTDQASEHMKAHELEAMDSHSALTRRRLLKGMATVAPMILTLRSGAAAAQAAASACTAQPYRLAIDQKYLKWSTRKSQCVERSLGGEVLPTGEACGVPLDRSKTDCYGNTIAFCPESNAVYSANAVSSLRCSGDFYS